MILGDDTKVVLLLAAAMFLWALLLGVWKFRQMDASEEELAHPYVDIAHRAALLYSFALLLVATFVELGGWGMWSTRSLPARSPSTSSPATRSIVGSATPTNQFRRPVHGMNQDEER